MALAEAAVLVVPLERAAVAVPWLVVMQLVVMWLVVPAAAVAAAVAAVAAAAAASVTAAARAVERRRFLTLTQSPVLSILPVCPPKVAKRPKPSSNESGSPLLLFLRCAL